MSVRRLGKLLNKSEGMSESEGAGEDFKPTKGDKRSVVVRQIAQRRGQQQFRNVLLGRYGYRCMMTGCKLLDVVEAAHIKPYRGPDDNHPENGLLLRSDIHTLFDLNLIGINPETWKVELNKKLLSHQEYRELSGCHLRLPDGFRPSKAAARLRYKEFKKNCRKK
jgi:putative restriction endonuclease